MAEQLVKMTALNAVDSLNTVKPLIKTGQLVSANS
ncbi:MAG: hypothetical protein ACJATQ_001402 [Cellvibrionaceae bacterium]|jgi:hypothetical protein